MNKDRYVDNIISGNVKGIKLKLVYYACWLLKIWKTKEEIRNYLLKIYTKKYGGMTPKKPLKTKTK